jgi:hypothetical protein
MKKHEALLKTLQYRINSLNQKLSKKYNEIVIPDRKLEDIRRQFGDI